MGAVPHPDDDRIEGERRVTEIFLERSFDSPLTAADVLSIASDTGWCFEMYDVAWRGSMLAADGRTLVCRFTAADVESARQALRKANADISVMWRGTVHEAPDARAGADANVLVERSFGESIELADLQAREDAHGWCLETRSVKFVRTFFSSDRRRMLCLYAAPDAEAVRQAQREAGMPTDRVWAFERIRPDAVA